MSKIEVNTLIEAPLERVFDLSRSIDAHIESATDTGEKAVSGRVSGLIGLGETVTWEAIHFGFKQRLKVEITEFERPYMFVDEMVSGAFASMKHVHRFSRRGSTTLMVDEFSFRAPLGILGRVVEIIILRRYMKNFLVQRGLILKRIAESSEWEKYLRH